MPCSGHPCGQYSSSVLLCLPSSALFPKSFLEISRFTELSHLEEVGPEEVGRMRPRVCPALRRWRPKGLGVFAKLLPAFQCCLTHSCPAGPFLGAQLGLEFMEILVGNGEAPGRGASSLQIQRPSDSKMRKVGCSVRGCGDSGRQERPCLTCNTKIQISVDSCDDQAKLTSDPWSTGLEPLVQNV